MKISLNYLKQYLDFDPPEINELAKVIGTRLGALEETPINLADLYKDVLIVKVESCQPIEGTDHLYLCLINDGNKRLDVERNSDGLIQVVCGAPNARAGILAAWLPPDSILPASYHKEQLVLEKRPIRGQVSSGMLASPQELSFSEDHDGILEADQGNPGDSFAEIYDLNDYLIDIENKMFTHRPDCFGVLGVAREISGILNHKFSSPSWYLKPEDTAVEGDRLDISVINEIPSEVPRFSLIVIDNVAIKPSPLSIQSYLARMGIRPINNIVDLTNIVMLETGQPLHAYDYHKLKALSGDKVSITVRYPKPNESLKLLNDKEIKPTDKTICIAAGDQLVGLGGVMGAKNSEVDEKTTAIVLEAACFDMYDIRRTAMELGVFSEAVTRFTKGQSPLQTVRVLSHAAQKLKLLLPSAKLASNIIDDIHLPEATIERDSVHPPVPVTVAFINERLGTNLAADQIIGLLMNVECQVGIESDSLTVSAPFWRTDLEIREDVIEEVGRLYGYENIQPTALKRPVIATSKNAELESKSVTRHLLAEAGANELLTYSFISKRLIENVGQDVTKAFELSNSLSPELAYYRLSLIPSLLTKVHINIKANIEVMALFEIGSYHLKGQFDVAEPDLPAEYPSLALVYASKQPSNEASFYKAKNYLSYLLNVLNISDINFEPLDKITPADHLVELAKPFDKTRSAVVKSGDNQWGVVGEFNDQTLSMLKLPANSGGFEVDSRLFLNEQRDKVYAQLPKYPPVKQDITLKVPDGPNFAELLTFMNNELASLVPKAGSFKLDPISIFVPEGSTGIKNYSFHLVIYSNQKTMTDEEVNGLLDKLATLAKDKFGADRV